MVQAICQTAPLVLFQIHSNLNQKMEPTQQFVFNREQKSHLVVTPKIFVVDSCSNSLNKICVSSLYLQ